MSAIMWFGWTPSQGTGAAPVLTRRWMIRPPGEAPSGRTNIIEAGSLVEVKEWMVRLLIPDDWEIYRQSSTDGSWVKQ